MTMPETIKVRNLGPVSELSFTLPEGGGLIELLGHNGVGKSTVLAAAQRALGGVATVEKTDGALRGALEICGVKLTVTGTGARRSGELRAATIEGRFNISDIVDPGIKNPEAADLARAKAILEITGKKPDLEQFKEACGGASLIEAVATDGTRYAKSLVEMATHLKADLEARRRIYQSRATALAGEVKALRESAAGVDLEVDTDQTVLEAAQRNAIRHEATLEEQARAASDAALRATEAAAAMAKAKAEYAGPTVEEAAEIVLNHTDNREAAELVIFDFERKLQEAKLRLTTAQHVLATAVAARGLAISHEQTVAQAEAALASASAVQRPTDGELATAAQAVRLANQAIFEGVAARSAKTALAEAEEKESTATTYVARAEELTTFAKATFEEVLTAAVDVPGITFSEGRMFWSPPGSGKAPELFDRLGRGERCKISSDIGIQRIRELGLDGIALLLLSQELNEGLDPTNRAMLVDHLKAIRAHMITARATDGPLRVVGAEVPPETN